MSPCQQTKLNDLDKISTKPRNYKTLSELESMFMKHYASNRCGCEPSIEVIMKMGVQWGLGRVFLGSVRVDVNVNEGLKLL